MITHEQLSEAFGKIPGINLISSAQAEHCGYHHFTFKTDEQTLTKLCKTMSDPPWLNCHFGVAYENGLLYYMSCPPSPNSDEILSCFINLQGY